MTRTRFAVPHLLPRSTHRFASVGAFLMLCGLLILAPALCLAEDPVRIAVAPFAGSQFGKSAAEAIAAELKRRPLERLIAPDAIVAAPIFDPPAEEIRRWAYNAAVEVVVVGRIVAAAPATEDEIVPHLIEIVLRSGHSGAELSRHKTTAGNPMRLQAPAARLASAILEDLGYTEPVAQSGDTRDSLHTVGFVSPNEAGAGSPGQGGKNDRDLDLRLGGDGFDTDAPIEIKADEAEIINRESGRELVFKHNVLVRQANVTLRSDHLAASYRKGESEPEKLIARGKVFVDQGDRRAKCDRVVYDRDTQRLTCTGHAELVQGCDIVRGEAIQFDLHENRARVEGAASIVIRPEGDTQATCGSMRGVM